jgi:hypothetical protein
MDLLLLQSRWKVGSIRPEDLHNAATELLDAGIESPALVRLAGMMGASSADVEPIMEEVFQEGGLAPVDDRTARWRIAYETARQIVSKEVSPLNGATQLWHLASDLDLPKPLRYFVYLAADYGEGPKDPATEKKWFDERIIEAAQELLSLRSSIGDSPPPDVD